MEKKRLNIDIELDIFVPYFDFTTTYDLAFVIVFVWALDYPSRQCIYVYLCHELSVFLSKT